MKFTALQRKREIGAQEDHAELSRKRRQAEAALTALHQKRLARTSDARPNPFLQPAPMRDADPLSLNAPPAGGWTLTLLPSQHLTST